MILKDLPPVERKHWELHINAVLKDDEGTPCLTNLDLKTEAELFLKGGELPDIKHPSMIHDWLEQPEKRISIEVFNG